MRIKCTKCNKIKTLNNTTYENLLTNFSRSRAFLIGLSHGIPNIFEKRFSIKEQLSKDKMEELFLKNYVCKSCQTNRPLATALSYKLSQILSLPPTKRKLRHQNKRHQHEKTI